VERNYKKDVYREVGWCIRTGRDQDSYQSINRQRPDDKNEHFPNSRWRLVRYQPRPRAGILGSSARRWDVVRSHSSGATGKSLRSEQVGSVPRYLDDYLATHRRVLPCGGRYSVRLLRQSPLPTARGTRPQDPGTLRQFGLSFHPKEWPTRPCGCRSVATAACARDGQDKETSSDPASSWLQPFKLPPSSRDP